MAMNKDNDDVAGDNGDDNNDGMYKNELNRKSLLGSLF